MRVENRIRALLDEAHDIAIAEIERRARQIMKQHKRCAAFCMGMGIATFYDRSGDSIGEDWGPRQYPQYLIKFMRFIDEFDGELHLTGTPMKIVGHDGVMRHDW